MTSGRRGQEQHPADDRADLVEAVAQPRHHAEVPAAAAQRPEQVRVVVGVDLQQLAAGRHDLGAQQVVDGHAVLADEEADAAAERDAGDADRARVAEPGGEAVGAGRGGVLAGGQARAGPGGARAGVDGELAQRAHVEHDAAVGGAVAGGAVAAAADGQLEPGLAGVRDDAGDVGRAGGAHDQGGAPVDGSHEDGPRLVVAGVIGRDDLAFDVADEVGSGEHRPRVTGRAGRSRTAHPSPTGRLAEPRAGHESGMGGAA